ncbi:MAG: hypothetical protein ACLQAT_27555, partial [Candidatus Binataceae bacterium]
MEKSKRFSDGCSSRLPLTITDDLFRGFKISPVCGELLILLENQQLSGGTMARTGLRMMPTFPSSSLRFRTAGF